MKISANYPVHPMDSVMLLGSEARPCQARVLSDLSGDRLCFLISTGAPELSHRAISYDAAFSTAAFAAKIRNVWVRKQDPIYAEIISRSFLYIHEREVTPNVEPVCCNKLKKHRKKPSATMLS